MPVQKVWKLIECTTYQFLEKRLKDGRDKRDHAFPNVISLKVNAIERLEFELVYLIIAVYYVSHYATKTFPA